MRNLYEVSECRNFTKVVDRRVEFIGHLLRHQEFVTNIIEVKVRVKRGRGRPKNPLLEDINHRMLISKHCHIKGAALNKREWLRLQGIAFKSLMVFLCSQYLTPSIFFFFGWNTLFIFIPYYYYL